MTTGLDVEAVLREHEAEHVNAYYCSCSDYRLDVPWAAHVAAVLREHIEREAESDACPHGVRWSRFCGACMSDEQGRGDPERD